MGEEREEEEREREGWRELENLLYWCSLSNDLSCVLGEEWGGGGEGGREGRILEEKEKKRWGDRESMSWRSRPCFHINISGRNKRKKIKIQ